MKLYKMTFKIGLKDYYRIADYISLENIIIGVLHYGNEINDHIHILSTESSFGYDGIFTYQKLCDDLIEAKNYVKYLQDGHCCYSIVFKPNGYYDDIINTPDRKLSLDDLINEIVDNLESGLQRPHRYWLRKYGQIYLKNFDSIRRLFDFSSEFYEFGANKLH